MQDAHGLNLSSGAGENKTAARNLRPVLLNAHSD